MPFWISEQDSGKTGAMKAVPVVRPGEDIQVWLRRAVPALMQDHGVPEEEARALAQEAWSRVNSGQTGVAQASEQRGDENPVANAPFWKPGAPKQDEEKPAGDKPEAPKQDAPKPAADKPQSQWPPAKPATTPPAPVAQGTAAGARPQPQGALPPPQFKPAPATPQNVRPVAPAAPAVPPSAAPAPAPAAHFAQQPARPAQPVPPAPQQRPAAPAFGAQPPAAPNAAQKPVQPPHAAQGDSGGAEYKPKPVQASPMGWDNDSKWGGDISSDAPATMDGFDEQHSSLPANADANDGFGNNDLSQTPFGDDVYGTQMGGQEGGGGDMLPAEATVADWAGNRSLEFFQMMLEALVRNGHSDEAESAAMLGLYQQLVDQYKMEANRRIAPSGDSNEMTVAIPMPMPGQFGKAADVPTEGAGNVVVIVDDSAKKAADGDAAPKEKTKMDVEIKALRKAIALMRGQLDGASISRRAVLEKSIASVEEQVTILQMACEGLEIEKEEEEEEAAGKAMFSDKLPKQGALFEEKKKNPFAEDEAGAVPAKTPAPFAAKPAAPIGEKKPNPFAAKPAAPAAPAGEKTPAPFAPKPAASADKPNPFAAKPAAPVGEKTPAPFPPKPEAPAAPFESEGDEEALWEGVPPILRKMGLPAPPKNSGRPMKGGPGSGYFSRGEPRPGRPGQRGGSADDGIANKEEEDGGPGGPSGPTVPEPLSSTKPTAPYLEAADRIARVKRRQYDDAYYGEDGTPTPRLVEKIAREQQDKDASPINETNMAEVTNRLSVWGYESSFDDNGDGTYTVQVSNPFSKSDRNAFMGVSEIDGFLYENESKYPEAAELARAGDMEGAQKSLVRSYYEERWKGDYTVKGKTRAERTSGMQEVASPRENVRIFSDDGTMKGFDSIVDSIGDLAADGLSAGKIAKPLKVTADVVLGAGEASIDVYDSANADAYGESAKPIFSVAAYRNDDLYDSRPAVDGVAVEFGSGRGLRNDDASYISDFVSGFAEGVSDSTGGGGNYRLLMSDTGRLHGDRNAEFNSAFSRLESGWEDSAERAKETYRSEEGFRWADEQE